MQVLVLTGFLLATTYGDIGLKLRQQQELLQKRIGSGTDVANNPFFIPKGSGDGVAAAATNVDARADGGAKTERTHTLEELCNDAFHSFLCKPVRGTRRRIDGNLRPGAAVNPLLRPDSSNTRENKLLPPLPGPTNSRPVDLQLSAKQTNVVEINKPLRNGYLPPDPRSTPAPTVQRNTIPTVTTKRPPQTTRFAPFTFPPTTQPPRNSYSVKLLTTPRPTFSTTQRRPVTFKTPQPTTPSFFTTRPPQTKRPTFTPFRTTTLRPPVKPVTFATSPPKYQTTPNTYLPPFTEKRTSYPVKSTNTITASPTVNKAVVNPFPTTKTVEVPPNSYLPPINPPIDIRFGSASNTREANALIPDRTQNTRVTAKPEEEHTLERLCNDPFHSFLCQPINKTRFRFDGRLRPQAVIPPGVLVPSNTVNVPVKYDTEIQSGSHLQPARVPTHLSNSYLSPLPERKPETVISPLLPQQTFLYPKRADNVSPSSSFISSATSEAGYSYPQPSTSAQFNFRPSSPIAAQGSSVSTTLKPFFQNNQFLQNNILTFNHTVNHQPLLAARTDQLSVINGYDYPKPQYPFPPSTPSPTRLTFDYVTPKTNTQFIYSTTTQRPTSVFIPSTLESVGTQTTLFTGYKYPIPTGQVVTASTTQRPSSLDYQFQNDINQVSPSLPAYTFVNYQNPTNQIKVSTESNSGYKYPKPEVPLLEPQSVTNDNGYFYPKPSISLPNNNLNSFGNSQFANNAKFPFTAFSKGAYSPRQSTTSTPPLSVRLQPSSQVADTKTAMNINQLLGPSDAISNHGLPPANQFEILKVKKRQNTS